MYGNLPHWVSYVQFCYIRTFFELKIQILYHFSELVLCHGISVTTVRVSKIAKQVIYVFDFIGLMMISAIDINGIGLFIVATSMKILKL